MSHIKFHHTLFNDSFDLQAGRVHTVSAGQKSPYRHDLDNAFPAEKTSGWRKIVQPFYQYEPVNTLHHILSNAIEQAQHHQRFPEWMPELVSIKLRHSLAWDNDKPARNNAQINYQGKDSTLSDGKSLYTIIHMDVNLLQPVKNSNKKQKGFTNLLKSSLDISDVVAFTFFHELGHIVHYQATHLEKLPFSKQQILNSDKNKDKELFIQNYELLFNQYYNLPELQKKKWNAFQNSLVQLVQETFSDTFSVATLKSMSDNPEQANAIIEKIAQCRDNSIGVMKKQNILFYFDRYETSEMIREVKSWDCAKMSADEIVEQCHELSVKNLVRVISRNLEQRNFVYLLAGSLSGLDQDLSAYGAHYSNNPQHIAQNLVENLKVTLSQLHPNLKHYIDETFQTQKVDIINRELNLGLHIIEDQFVYTPDNIFNRAIDKIRSLRTSHEFNQEIKHIKKNHKV